MSKEKAMAFRLTKFLGVWAACPELRPDWLIPNDNPLGTWSIDPHEMDMPMRIPESMAAAIIRDKCVWWLAEQGDCECLVLSKTGKSHFASVETPGDDVDPKPSSDPTEALYLECCAVLGITP